jgi:putative transcriptional regulator
MTSFADQPRCRSAAIRIVAAVFLVIAARSASLGAQPSPWLTGQFLVATPEMRDPNFSRTVIYMVKHDEDGATGLVVNRPIAKGPIEDLLKSLRMESEGAGGEIILHYGGPVEPGKGFVLHTDDYTVESTTVVEKGVALTADVEILRAISLGKGPRQSLFLLGYAGWAPGQLEAELKANAWFTIPAEADLIFSVGAERKWERALDKRKITL